MARAFRGLLAFGAAGALALAMASSARAHMIIVPHFASSITQASNAVEIEADIRNSLKFYNNFSNPVKVRIVFGLFDQPLGPNGGKLAINYSSNYYDDYSDVVNNLNADAASHPGNTVLNTAVAHLGQGNVPQVESSSFLPPDQWLLINSANMRALGYSEDPTTGAPGYLYPGDIDGYVFLNSAAGPNGQPLLSFSDPPLPDQGSAASAIQHEVDEVLGAGGYGSTLGDQQGPFTGVYPNLQGALGLLDLYRYSAPGVPSFTTDPNADAYFSVDGGQTDIDNFNQDPTGDYGDWLSPTCPEDNEVQVAFLCPGVSPKLSVDSTTVKQLEAIGYDLGGAVPEPSAWLLMLLGVGLTGARLRLAVRRFEKTVTVHSIDLQSGSA